MFHNTSAASRAIIRNGHTIGDFPDEHTMGNLLELPHVSMRDRPEHLTHLPSFEKLRPRSCFLKLGHILNIENLNNFFFATGQSCFRNLLNQFSSSPLPVLFIPFFSVVFCSFHPSASEISLAVECCFFSFAFVSFACGCLRLHPFLLLSRLISCRFVGFFSGHISTVIFRSRVSSQTTKNLNSLDHNRFQCINNQIFFLNKHNSVTTQKHCFALNKIVSFFHKIPSVPKPKNTDFFLNKIVQCPPPNTEFS